MPKNDTEKLFELLPVKPGKILEISEATAASSVPIKERVNFHIGNPVQDESLTLDYLSSVLNLKQQLNDFNSELICNEIGWEISHKKRIEFLYNTIKNSTPYSPRGGFNVKNPTQLIQKIFKWLTQEQEEPLFYDLGDKTGKREIIISSGGIKETLRILFHSLNSYLVHKPAKIFLIDYKIDPIATDFDSLNFTYLNGSDVEIYEIILKFLSNNKDKPVYIVIGRILSEAARRNLRNLSLKYPLSFIEINDAPNYLSLAREAKLKNRVLRIITPSFISPRLKDLSVTFVAARPQILKIFESVHFQLKGTPSASEIELLQYFIQYPEEIIDNQPPGDSSLEEESLMITSHSFLPDLSTLKEPNFIYRVEKICNSKLEKFSFTAAKVSNIIRESVLSASDTLMNKDTIKVLDEFFYNIDNRNWHNEIVESFKTAFVKQHPEYTVQNIVVVSGSSRTALGLFGFHCSFDEVVACDLSWNYEHCFPTTRIIPLTEEFELDVNAICQTAEVIKNKGEGNNRRVAIVLNNPHNASGKIFRERDLKEILVQALTKNIFVIDDLAYQNVLPENSLNGPKTIKQLALELVKEGKIYKDNLCKIITVHSLSKTDCAAGARLAVVEINDLVLYKRFVELNNSINPNISSILIAYLFYRNDAYYLNRFWYLRNRIFKAKMDALESAVEELPEDRNPFRIHIDKPQGSMYPRMVIENLPHGLSLDWLSSGLASQGIGLVPLSSFARTSKGYELGRKSFRLTLGGIDSPESLLRKTRRVLIDLNRMITEEKSKYNKHTFAILPRKRKENHYFDSSNILWKDLITEINDECRKIARKMMRDFAEQTEDRILSERFFEKFLPQRLNVFNEQYKDHLNISLDYLSMINTEGSKILKRQLEYEFFKDNIEDRKLAFKKRSYDRTVHPTQIYAVDTDILFNSAIDKILRNEKPGSKLVSKISSCLIDEYLGRNIAINSIKEGEELICDLRSLIAAEQFTSLYSAEPQKFMLSFWGDWDGSNRPSGQGHRLVASALLENVIQLSNIIKTVHSIDKSIKIDQQLLIEINQLGNFSKNFWDLLNDITTLTNQLEKRYRSVLPFSVESSRLRKLAVQLHLAQDPIIKLWQHNDRLEQKMIELRQERRDKLEYYFKLNKQLRKTLYELIPFIINHSSNPKLMLEAGLYRDILKRFILTPRIHQKLITAKDQFAINTTAHNIAEINGLSGNYGNPGMVLGLQVSMSTNPEALISLDKKLVTEREKIINKTGVTEIPKVWSIPLFEDLDNVISIENYLDKIWDYAVQSRSIEQEPKERFTEIICEVFVAGSDLSQQVGQTESSLLYNTAKHKTIEWLAKKGLVENVRMKLGCGEPMQRQGGYYAEFSSKPAFIKNEINEIRFSEYLKESTIKSTEFAVSPLHGVFAGGDLRTLQSAISEQIRYLNNHDRSQLLFHLYRTQKFYQDELIRASEPFIDTRLVYESKSLNELERLTLGKQDSAFNEFAELTKNNFQQIVYGTEEDVVGIHIISYFLSRAMPILRDRPVERPTKGSGDNKGQKILERIASIIPLAKHGSMLRAISHNKAQTFVLGINQLTTGLFRALNQFSQMDFVGGSGYQLINDRILPILPVYEILHTIRIFQDYELRNIQKFSDSFPPGISAFALLREDIDSLEVFVPMLQKELLRRHGINVTEFFKGDKFIYELLPTLRPDLAVLLQPDITNTKTENVTQKIKYEIPQRWLDEFSGYLIIPDKIRYWREKIWQLLEEPIKNQVKSFVELAVALNYLSKDIDTKEFNLSSSIKKSKYETSLTDLLRGKVDDSMRQFLSAAVQYLTRLPAEMVEVPIDIVRALKEVERILRIEEQALSKSKQEMLNFYLAQIARHVGDNG